MVRRRASARAVQETFQSVLDGQVDRARLGEDLFGITDALDGTVALRRALTDPSRDGAAKARPRRAAVRRQGRARRRSSSRRRRPASAGRAERDLTDTLESLAVASVVASAEAQGRADQMEDELFRFERIVAGNPGLRDALTDRRADAAEQGARSSARCSRARPTPRPCGWCDRRSARRAAAGSTGCSTATSRSRPTRRDQLAATVTAAVPLDEQQRRRLAAALSGYYGKTVHLNVVVDPAVIGGIRVQVGDEVVDGTILRRLEEAQRHLAG